MHPTITFSQAIAGIEFNNEIRFEEGFGRVVCRDQRDNVRTFIVSDFDRSHAIDVSCSRRGNGDRLRAVEERIVDSGNRESDRSLSVRNNYGGRNSRFRCVATSKSRSDCACQIAGRSCYGSHCGPTVLTHERLVDGDIKPEWNRG